MFNQMTNLDWILLAITFIFTVIGFMRGAVAKNLPIFAIFIALYLSFSFMNFFGDWSKQYFNNEILSNIIGYVLCFITILIVAKILKFIVKSVIQSTSLNVIDKPLGAILSFIKTSFSLIFLIALASLSSLSNTITYRQSQVIEALDPQINWMIDHLPNSLSDVIDKRVADDFDSQKAQVYDAIREKSEDITKKIQDGSLKQIDKVSYN